MNTKRLIAALIFTTLLMLGGCTASEAILFSIEADFNVLDFCSEQKLVVTADRIISYGDLYEDDHESVYFADFTIYSADIIDGEIFGLLSGAAVTDADEYGKNYMVHISSEGELLHKIFYSNDTDFMIYYSYAVKISDEIFIYAVGRNADNESEMVIIEVSAKTEHIKQYTIDMSEYDLWWPEGIAVVDGTPVLVCNYGNAPNGLLYHLATNEIRLWKDHYINAVANDDKKLYILSSGNSLYAYDKEGESELLWSRKKIIPTGTNAKHLLFVSNDDIYIVDYGYPGDHLYPKDTFVTINRYNIVNQNAKNKEYKFPGVNTIDFDLSDSLYAFTCANLSPTQTNLRNFKLP